MTVNLNCVRSVDTALPQESVWAAAERMHQHAVGALVVVNEYEEPIGILTDRDLMERVIVGRLDPDATSVEHVMTKRPRTIYDGASIESALAIMRGGPIRRLPVVDHEGKLAGLLCLDDLLIRSAREFAAIGQILKSETPAGVAEGLLPNDLNTAACETR